jgi:hypothetical protein
LVVQKTANLVLPGNLEPGEFHAEIAAISDLTPVAFITSCHDYDESIHGAPMSNRRSAGDGAEG